MNEDRLYRLITNPDSITDKDRKDLDDMALKWPWCNTMQLLNLKAGYAFEPVTYQRLLKKSAPAVTDRKILYKLIHTADPKRLPYTPVEAVLKEKQKEEQKRQEEKEKAEAANKANLEVLEKENTEEVKTREEKTPAKAEAETTKPKEEPLPAEKSVTEKDQKAKLAPPKSKAEEPSAKPGKTEEAKTTETESAETLSKPVSEGSPKSKAALAEEIMQRIEEIRKKRAEWQEDKKTAAPAEKDKLTDGPENRVQEEVKKKEVSEEKPPEMLELDDSNDDMSGEQRLVPPSAEASRGVILDLDYTLPPEEPSEKKVDKDENPKDELIDKFIEEEPRIVPRDRSEAADRTDIAGKGTEESEHMYVTETLAEIYSRQGYYEKAIQVYDKLLLKNPEKSAYFASQIKKLRKSLKNK